MIFVFSRFLLASVISSFVISDFVFFCRVFCRDFSFHVFDFVS